MRRRRSRLKNNRRGRKISDHCRRFLILQAHVFSTNTLKQISAVETSSEPSHLTTVTDNDITDVKQFASHLQRKSLSVTPVA